MCVLVSNFSLDNLFPYCTYNGLTCSALCTMQKAMFNGWACSCSRTILCLQPHNKAAMLVVNTINMFVKNLHKNEVHFQAERNDFAHYHQHGRHERANQQWLLFLRCSDTILK